MTEWLARARAFWGRRGKIGKTAIIVLFVLIALAIVGALIPTESDETASTMTTEAVVETETETTETQPPPQPPSPPTPLPGSTPPAPASDEPVLTALGATRAAWLDHHSPDPAYAADCCFGPRVDDRQPRYYLAFWTDDGHIEGYSMAFRPNASFSEAKAVLLDELPPDAKLIFDITKGLCRILQYDSKLYGRAVGSRAINVALYSSDLEDPYNGTVRTAILLAGIPRDRSIGC